MNIAVFADIHGRILLCFKLVDRYQRETGRHIDLILQCGDMGIFPDLSKLDKATLRYAEKDGTELGFFNDFVQPRDDIIGILSRTDSDLICVRGNHEDHDHLDSLENLSDSPIFSVDCYKRIYVMKTGVPYTFEKEAERITMLGIGRVGPTESKQDTEKAKYIQGFEKKRLNELGRFDIDVLVTHDSAKNFVAPGFGMEEIRVCLNKFKPRYHFYGHTGKPYEIRQDTNGFTKAVKVSDFEWQESEKSGVLKSGCLGVLEWQDPDSHKLEIITERWLSEYTRYTWKYI